jgi:hypothetical protein
MDENLWIKLHGDPNSLMLTEPPTEWKVLRDHLARKGHGEANALLLKEREANGWTKSRPVESG